MHFSFAHKRTWVEKLQSFQRFRRSSCMETSSKSSFAFQDFLELCAKFGWKPEYLLQRCKMMIQPETPPAAACSSFDLRSVCFRLYRWNTFYVWQKYSHSRGFELQSSGPWDRLTGPGTAASQGRGKRAGVGAQLGLNETQRLLCLYRDLPHQHPRPVLFTLAYFNTHLFMCSVCAAWRDWNIPFLAQPCVVYWIYVDQLNPTCSFKKHEN